MTRGRPVGFRRGGPHGRRADRSAAPRRPSAGRDGRPGARRLPDPRLRGAADHPRRAVSRRRRPALLRAAGDPRRHRLYARAARSRPTTWRSSASSTCRGAASARRRCAPCTRRPAPRRFRCRDAAARLVAERRAEGPGARDAGRQLLRGFARWRAHAGARRPRGDGRDDAGRERLHRDVEAGQIARSAGPAGEPEGTGPRAGGFRDPGRLPRSRRRW